MEKNGRGVKSDEPDRLNRKDSFCDRTKKRRNLPVDKGKKLRTVILTLIFLFCLAAPAQAAFSKKAPASLKAKKQETSVTITWTGRKSLTGYQVYKTNASGGNKTKVKTVKTTSVTIKNLKPGKTYYYRVRGYLKKNGKTKYTKFSKVLKVKMPAKKDQETTTAKSTLKQLLLTGLQPVGSTMYVWGGGWNKADTGAGTAARTIGVSPKWKQFFNKQDSSYDYRTTRYQIANGLDCSGYIGWCIYNILNTENGKAGYVMPAQNMASNFASRGWGTYRSRSGVTNYRAGDIMSSSGHVWMVVGQCNDGSVVLLHSSPPGVQLAGTPSSSGKTNSRAVKLATTYMKKYFPKWYKKYPNCAVNGQYLTQYAQMRWDISGDKIMTDPDNYRKMNASQILKDLFASRS